MKEDLLALKDAPDKMADLLSRLERQLSTGKAAGTLSQDHMRRLQKELAFLQAGAVLPTDQIYEHLKAAYGKKVQELNAQVETSRNELTNLFTFLEEVFDGGQELLLFITELTINSDTARFLSHYGCDKYYAHSKELQFYERNKEIARELQDLEL